MKRVGLTLMVLFATVCCFGFINAAIADETSFNRHTGPFAEASLGATYIWFAGLEVGGTEFNEGAAIGPGWSIGGGYMFKDWIGAEGGYLQCHPKVGDEAADGTIGGPYITSRFSIPVKDRFSVLIKAGLMFFSFSDDAVEDDTSFAFLFSGIGIGYALTDKIDLRAQFQGPNVLLFGAGVLSGGITYHF